MKAGVFRHDCVRGALQIGLLLCCCASVLGLRAATQADGLTDAQALALQGTGAGILLLGAIVATLLSRRPRSLPAALVLRAFPLCLLLIAAAFAKSSYADVSVELEAIRESRLPKGPDTTIVLGPTGSDVRLVGEMTEGAAERLAVLLAANPAVVRIHLTSEGGLAEEGQALGNVIAAHHLVTYVPDYCVSACTLAFVRGRERLLLDDSRLGFHAPYQPALFGQMIQGDSDVQRAAYVDAGVAPDFAEAALKVASSEIWIPQADRLIAAHVATGLVDRFRFPDSSLDGAVTPENARGLLLRSFPVLGRLDTRSPALDAIVRTYIQAYRDGRSEGEMASKLRLIVAETVPVAPARKSAEILATLTPDAR